MEIWVPKYKTGGLRGICFLTELKQHGHFSDILSNKEVLENNEVFIWASYVRLQWRKFGHQ